MTRSLDGSMVRWLHHFMASWLESLMACWFHGKCTMICLVLMVRWLDVSMLRWIGSSRWLTDFMPSRLHGVHVFMASKFVGAIVSCGVIV